jgi:hypothetical protein
VIKKQSPQASKSARGKEPGLPTFHGHPDELTKILNCYSTPRLRAMVAQGAKRLQHGELVHLLSLVFRSSGRESIDWKE